MDLDPTFVKILVGGVAVAVVFLWPLVKLVKRWRVKRKSQEFIGENVFAFMRVSESSEEPQKFEDSKRRFKTFITKVVIPSTEDQRNKWQFATLMLLTAKETKKFCYEPSQNGGQPKLYENETFSPKSGEFNNYIIARPQNGENNTKHAEEVILENFVELLGAYKNQNSNQIPASIILYSWIMPCKDCTDAIIEKLLSHGIPITIVYTISWEKESKEIQAKSRKSLKKKGVSVVYVKCPYRLQPKSR